jgi:hypothetical protein
MKFLERIARMQVERDVKAHGDELRGDVLDLTQPCRDRRRIAEARHDRLGRNRQADVGQAPVTQHAQDV